MAGGSVPSTTSSGSIRITSTRWVSIDTNRVKTTWISSTPPSSVGVRNASISASAISRACAYVGASEKPSLCRHLAAAEGVEGTPCGRSGRAGSPPAVVRSSWVSCSPSLITEDE